MGDFNTLIRFFQDGGAFMYPIALVLGVGVAIAIERYVYLTVVRAANRKMWNDLTSVLDSGDYQKAYNLTSQSDSAVAKIINYGLSRLGSSTRLEDVEAAMEEGLMEVIPRLEKRTHYVATYANLSTLLGLLGTVVGLIQAFAAVANADPADKAQLLSSSIAVAMNTTAFGLIAAIPLLLIYTVLQAKTTEIIDSLEMATVKFNNLVRRHRNKQANPQ